MIDRATEPAGNDDPQPAPMRKSGSRMRPAALLVGGVIGAVVVLAAILTYALFMRVSTPRLTDAEFQSAVKRWEAGGPASYAIDLELTGNRPGKIHVEVRDGQIVHMTRDGVQPAQERTWYYWTVPGQFDTIEQELEMARDPAGSFNAPGATQMVIRATFDPKLGYPLSYDRVVLGADFEIHWKVTRFEVLVAKK